MKEQHEKAKRDWRVQDMSVSRFWGLLTANTRVQSTRQQYRTGTIVQSLQCKAFYIKTLQEQATQCSHTAGWLVQLPQHDFPHKPGNMKWSPCSSQVCLSNLWLPVPYYQYVICTLFSTRLPPTIERAWKCGRAVQLFLFTWSCGTPQGTPKAGRKVGWGRFWRWAHKTSLHLRPLLPSYAWSCH